MVVITGLLQFYKFLIISRIEDGCKVQILLFKNINMCFMYLFLE